MNSTLLKQLVDLGDAFEQTHPADDQQTLTNFLAWARQTDGQVADQPGRPLLMPERYTSTIPIMPTFIVEHMNKVYEYFKLYMKKACAQIPLLNYDDYLVLVYLAERGSMTKTQMIEATVNEKTSGMLVMKRLIDQGFISQANNPGDRRSRCITLTDAGLSVLKSVQPAVNQAMFLFVGKLSEADQLQLAGLLDQLNTFHEPLYLHHREASLDELVSQLH